MKLLQGQTNNAFMVASAYNGAHNLSMSYSVPASEGVRLNG